MRSGSNFKNMPAVLILYRVDASKSPNFFYLRICQQSKKKSKETCIPTNESQIKSSRVFISELESKVKGRSVTCFENIARIRRLIYPNFFFRPTCSWNDCSSPEYSLVGWSHVPECFLSLEFCLNSELVSSVARHKFKKFVKNSGSTLFQILHRQ